MARHAGPAFKDRKTDDAMSAAKNQVLAASVAGVLVTIAGLVVYQIDQLRVAHSTFENYYAFRGCVRLMDRTEVDGHCETADGREIRIVEYHGAWYLDGDLPWACLGSICIGI